MSKNLQILGRILAENVIERARRGPQPVPHSQLMEAMEDAIADAKERRDSLVVAGLKDSQACHQINGQIARWESARRVNR